MRFELIHNLVNSIHLFYIFRVLLGCSHSKSKPPRLQNPLCSPPPAQSPPVFQPTSRKPKLFIQHFEILHLLLTPLPPTQSTQTCLEQIAPQGFN